MSRKDSQQRTRRPHGNREVSLEDLLRARPQRNAAPVSSDVSVPKQAAPRGVVGTIKLDPSIPPEEAVLTATERLNAARKKPSAIKRGVLRARAQATVAAAAAQASTCASNVAALLSAHEDVQRQWQVASAAHDTAEVLLGPKSTALHQVQAVGLALQESARRVTAARSMSAAATEALQHAATQLEMIQSHRQQQHNQQKLSTRPKQQLPHHESVSRSRQASPVTHQLQSMQERHCLPSNRQTESAVGTQKSLSAPASNLQARPQAHQALISNESAYIASTLQDESNEGSDSVASDDSLADLGGFSDVLMSWAATSGSGNLRQGTHVADSSQPMCDGNISSPPSVLTTAAEAGQGSGVRKSDEPVAQVPDLSSHCSPLKYPAHLQLRLPSPALAGTAPARTGEAESLESSQIPQMREMPLHFSEPPALHPHPGAKSPTSSVVSQGRFPPEGRPMRALQSASVVTQREASITPHLSHLEPLQQQLQQQLCLSGSHSLQPSNPFNIAPVGKQLPVLLAPAAAGADDAGNDNSISGRPVSGSKAATGPLRTNDPGGSSLHTSRVIQHQHQHLANAIADAATAVAFSKQALQEPPGLRSPVNLQRRQGRQAVIGDYCQQVIDEETDAATSALLQQLLSWQDRARASRTTNPGTRVANHVAHRKRLVSGLREVAKWVRIGKACAVVVAPNIEPVEGETGLSALLASILADAEAHGIPVIFALSRKRLGQIFGWSKKMSAIAVLDVSGADVAFQQLVALAVARQQWWRQTRGLSGALEEPQALQQASESHCMPSSMPEPLIRLRRDGRPFRAENPRSGNALGKKGAPAGAQARPHVNIQHHRPHDPEEPPPSERPAASNVLSSGGGLRQGMHIVAAGRPAVPNGPPEGHYGVIASTRPGSIATGQQLQVPSDQLKPDSLGHLQRQQQMQKQALVTAHHWQTATPSPGRVTPLLARFPQSLESWHHAEQGALLSQNSSVPQRRHACISQSMPPMLPLPLLPSPSEACLQHQQQGLASSAVTERRSSEAAAFMSGGTDSMQLPGDPMGRLFAEAVEGIPRPFLYSWQTHSQTPWIGPNGNHPAAAAVVGAQQFASKGAHDAFVARGRLHSAPQPSLDFIHVPEYAPSMAHLAGYPPFMLPATQSVLSSQIVVYSEGFEHS